MTTNRHFDWLAPFYDHMMQPPDPERLLALLELPAGQPAPGWMLDAAGGTGRVASVICPRVQRLVISDLSYPMLVQAASKSAACIRTAQARVERLPYSAGQFNRILVVDAFHHFADQPGAVRELARVLGPGGRLVIEEPDIRRPMVKLIALGERLLLMGSHFRTPDHIRALMTSCGLDARVEVDSYTAWVVGIKG